MQIRGWQSAFVRYTVSRELLSRRSSQHLGSLCRPLCWPSRRGVVVLRRHPRRRHPAMKERSLTGSKNNSRLAVWLETLAGKATAALPGVIGAIVSWLLKTAGSVAVWLVNTCGQRFSLWSPQLRFIIARGSRLWQNLLPRR